MTKAATKQPMGKGKPAQQGTGRSRGDPVVHALASRPRTANVQRLPKGTMTAGASALGHALGGPMGGLLGGLGGRLLSTITGMGDYQVESNTLADVGVSTAPDTVPTFTRTDHSVIVKHREYIGDLIVPAVPGAFSNTTYTMNPGNPALFPWFASVASKFQEYRLKGCVMEFKSMYSDYSAAGPLGTVIIASNYNALAAPYANKLEMDNSEYAVSTKPSKTIIHPIECKPGAGRSAFLNVRNISQTVQSPGDARLYDWCTTQVATQGLGGTPGQVLGELWLSYEVEVCKPILVDTSPSINTRCSRIYQSTTVDYEPQTIPFTAQSGAQFVQNTMTTSTDPALQSTPGTLETTREFRFLKEGTYTFMWWTTGVNVTTTGPITVSQGTAAAAPTMVSWAYILYSGTPYGATWATVSVRANNLGSLVVFPNVSATSFSFTAFDILWTYD